MDKITQLLKDHSLRKTAIRRHILALFIQSQHALTHALIEEDLKKDFDRVTIYRTLKSFEENGLIHRIVDDGDTVKFALCKDHHCSEHSHFDNHVHFKCELCQHTFCMDYLKIPDITTPLNYHATSFQFLILGICETCFKTQV
jgi:Fur family ferric uptake transcriptional regulator